MKIYVLEDEINVLTYILRILEKISYVQVVGTAASVEIGLLEIPIRKPDVILCDIQLRDKLSFQIFQELSAENYQIIFMTAYSHYAIQALNLGAIAYLLKPIDPEELKHSLQKALLKKEEFSIKQNQINVLLGQVKEGQTMDKLVIKNQASMQVISICQIVYCEGNKGYTSFHLLDGTRFMASKILKEYENILPAAQFLRCHQSYLINLNYIKTYMLEGWIILEGGVKIPVSERKKDIIHKYLKAI